MIASLLSTQHRRYLFPLLVWLLLALLLGGCAGTTKPPLPPAPPVQGNAQAVRDALTLQGAPYRFGGESPAQGFDCSGLVHYVYARQGVNLPRDTLSMAQTLPSVPPEERRPGDLLFFDTDKPWSHVGLYIGHDAFVHAASSNTGRVMVSDLNLPYWRERFLGVRRPPRVRARR